MTTPEIPATAASDEEPANQHTEPSADAAGTGGSRLAAARDWLHGHADTSLARLALLWFRRCFEASRNSGAAATTYMTLSVLPTALVIVAVFNLAKGDENAFADRLISHMNLGGSTASVVHDLFGTTEQRPGGLVTIVIGFLLWGLSIGQFAATRRFRSAARRGTASATCRSPAFFALAFAAVSLAWARSVGAASGASSRSAPAGRSSTSPVVLVVPICSTLRSGRARWDCSVRFRIGRCGTLLLLQLVTLDEVDGRQGTGRD